MKHLLKDFKKVDDNEKYSTFKHKNGHEIKIAKKGLSKNMKKGLEDLPHYDKGGVFEGDRSPDSADSFADPNSHAPAEPVDTTVQDEVPQAASAPVNPAQDPKNYSAGVYNLGDQGQSNGVAQPAMNSAPPPVSQEGKKEAQQYSGPAATKQQQGPGFVSKYAQEYMGGVGQQQAGIAGTAGVEEQGQKDIANTLGNLSNFEHGQVGGMGDIIQNKATQALDEQRKVQSDLANNHIDPNRLWHNKSTGSKIATAIGLFLGGFGQGLVGGSNPAMDYLHQQIDKDVEAQKTDNQNLDSIYQHNFQMFGNEMDAVKMSKANLLDATAHKIESFGATMKSQNAINNALNLSGELRKQSAMLTSQIGQGSGGQPGQQSRPEDTIRQLEISKFMSPEESKETMKQLDEYRNTESTKNNILDAANQIYKEQNLANRVLNPIQSRQQIDNLNLKIDAQGAKALGARYASIKDDMHNLTASFLTNKITAKQMQDTLNNIFGQHENYSYLTKWGLINQPQTQGPMKQESSGQIKSFRPKQ